MTSTTLSPLNRLSVNRVTLTASQRHYLAPAGETLIHILIGTIGVTSSAGDFPHLGERANVFDAPPTCLYLPPRAEFVIYPETRIADVIVVTAAGIAAGWRPAKVVRPQDVTLEYPGGHFPQLQRTVRVVADASGPAGLIYGGETINPPGGWSSYPHHEFDERAEWFDQFEEVFTVFHRPQSISVRNMETMLRRRGRFCDGSAVDDVVILKAGESAVVPLGVHPIAAPLEGELLYVWHYLSPLAKQYATRAEDGGMYK